MQTCCVITFSFFFFSLLNFKMKFKKIKLNSNYFLIFCTSLLLVVVLPIVQSQTYGNSQYGYSSGSSGYSTLPQLPHNSPITDTVDEINKIDSLKSGSGGVTDVIKDPIQRSQKTTGSTGSSTQGKNVFYYEMFPSPPEQPRQMCTYNGIAMKCQLKRESMTTSSTQIDGVGFKSNHVGSTGTARDTYSTLTHDVPTSSSYNIPNHHYGTPDNQYGAPEHHHYAPSHEYGAPSHSYGVPSYKGNTGYGYGHDDGYHSGGGGGGGLSGLSGLIGLIGLKGLKGLKALKPFLLGLPFLPLLLPILIILLILPLLPFVLFLPIPLLVIPNQGRSLNVANGTDASLKLIRLRSMIPDIAYDAFENEECIERMSCLISQMSRKYNAENLVQKVANILPKNNHYAIKFAKGFSFKPGVHFHERNKTSENSDHDCLRFVCKPKSIIAKNFEAFSKKL